MMLLLGFASQLMFYGSAEKKTSRKKKNKNETRLVCEVLYREVFHKDLDALWWGAFFRTQLSPPIFFIERKKHLWNKAEIPIKTIRVIWGLGMKILYIIYNV